MALALRIAGIIDEISRRVGLIAVWLVLFAMLNLGALVLGIQLLTPQLWQQL